MQEAARSAKPWVGLEVVASPRVQGGVSSPPPPPRTCLPCVPGFTTHISDGVSGGRNPPSPRAKSARRPEWSAPCGSAQGHRR